MAVSLMLKITAKPGHGWKVITYLAPRLKETRAFPGCESVALYTVDDQPDRALLLARWASIEDYEKYVAWRQGSGAMDQLMQLLARPLEVVKLQEAAT